MEDVVNNDGAAPGEPTNGSTPEAAASPGAPPPPPESTASVPSSEDVERVAAEADSVANADAPDQDREDTGAARDEPSGAGDELIEPRPSPDVRPLVHKHFVAPALIPLERVDADEIFLLRAEEPDEDDVSALATDIARLGQLFPIDVRLKAPDRFQVITGFRRVAALRLLQREKVLARLHTDLSDADALLMALASAIHGQEVGREELEAARERLSAEGRLTPAARDMLQRALSDEDGLAPEEVEEEVDADELASDVTLRLGQCNQDLSLLADVFEELDEARREELLTQLRYSAELVAFLEGKR
ncbi:MAG: ParB N-terminal domain-containing protein [Myxococcota bacterium]